MTDQRDVASPALDADRLERYVLGLLDEHEREQVEARAFAEPMVATAIDSAETDLVDAHVAGLLSGERREAFAGALAGRPRLRTRVATARALAARRPAARIPRWWLPMLAAASVLVVAGLWVLRQTAPQPGRAPIDASQRAESSPGAPSDLPAAREHTVARDAHPLEAESEAVAPPPTATQPARVTFAIQLPVGGTRRAAPTEAAIPASATHVLLQVPVAPGDDFGHFRLRLRDAAGGLVRESTAAQLPRDRTLQLVVDRTALADGTYDVELEGRQEGGPFEPLAFLQVRLALAPTGR